MKPIEDFVGKIICGDCLKIMRDIPDNSIDVVLTSPPYWALRDYSTNPQIWGGDKNCKHIWREIDVLRKATKGDKPSKNSKVAINRTNSENRPGKPSDFCSKCGAWRGELGLEPTFDLYISHLCDIFDEAKRVLKKSGSCWVVIGDTYSGSGAGQKDTGKAVYKEDNFRKNPVKTNLPNKCLCQIPFRFSIEMCNRGWILRNTIIWHKNNCMPSSVNDRFTVDFEYVFFFTKNKKYFFNQQFEPMLSNEYDKKRMSGGRKEYKGKWSDSDDAESYGSPRARTQRKKSWDSKRIQTAFVAGYKQGRNKRCVWNINTKRFKEPHFAVFPEKLIEPMIDAGCPRYVCSKCGKPREKIYEVVGHQITDFIKIDGGDKNGKYYGSEQKDYESSKTQKPSETKKRIFKSMSEIKDYKYSDCHCGAKFKPGIVLDPFLGAGTTAVVAKKLGRNFIGIELNPDYIEIAKKRLANIEKPLDNYESN